MTYLLDTNVLIWATASVHNLGRSSKRLIERSDSLHYSGVSVFEMLIKQQNNKLIVPNGYFSGLTALGIRELPFTSKHAQELSRFGTMVHHDPFDRMILCQAAGENFTLITGDQKLIALDLPWIIDART